MDRKTELLQKVQLFSSLNTAELKLLADFSGFRNFTEGEIVFAGHEHLRELYVVEKGEVIITRTEEDVERNIAAYIEGDAIGELSLFSGAQNGATARAGTDCRLLTFPAEPFNIRKIAEDYPEIFSSVFYKCIVMIAGRIRKVNTLISEKTPWIQDLRRKLYTDKLTGLLNRKFLDENLRDEIPDLNLPLHCLMIKPDRFKYINDTYGHESGDRTLHLIAARIKTFSRSADFAVRYLGDEFALIVQELRRDEMKAYCLRAADYLKKIDLSAVLKDDTFRITFSIGAAEILPAALEKSFEAAHQKMMEVWSSGGDGIHAE